MATLEIIEGSKKGELISLPLAGVFIIGRDAAVGLELNDAKISRRQCAIEITEEGFFLSDLASKNGTFLNETPVQRKRLMTGDRIRLGPVEMLFNLGQDETQEMAVDADAEQQVKTTTRMGARVAVAACDVCEAEITLAVIEIGQAKRVWDMLLCPDCIIRMEAFHLEGIMGVESLQRLLKTSRARREQDTEKKTSTILERDGLLPVVTDSPNKDPEGSAGDGRLDESDPSMTRYIEELRRRKTKKMSRHKKFSDDDAPSE